MQTIEVSNVTAGCLNGKPWNVAFQVSRPRDPVETNFLATLLAMAGHDLRQPLQIITSAHDVLTTTNLSTEQRRELDQATSATVQLSRMLGQLVEAVQLHELVHEELCVPVPLHPIFEELAVEFSEPARLKGITCRFRGSRQVALSHPILLAGILRNLIRNAIDYTPRGGKVSVDSRRYGSELHINFSDSGIGIPAGSLSRIFSPFQRSDGSHSDGLGLGLFIVKRAADLLRHRIGVRSIEGRGSSFTIATRVWHKDWQRSSPTPRADLGHGALRVDF